jgi:hypothetical protein
MIDYLDEIIGQETAKNFIRTSIKKGNLYNYLFTGPKGVGKRLCSFALAKTLQCPPHSPNFILVAPIPSKIKDKKEKIYEYTQQYLPENPLIEIEDRTSILIEQIRDVIERLLHMPNIGSKRVVLVLEADTMTDAAANCFLKTLEEPPLDTVFILTTSRLNFLLPTIQSRCQKIPFTYLNDTQIKNIVFAGDDEFQVGSPGEILMLQQSNLVENVLDIFRKLPLTIKNAATLAKEFENKKAIDLLYPLLLLYRLALYHKIGIVNSTRLDSGVKKKADTLSLQELVQAVMIVNYSINTLEQNPHRLLLLFNILTKLP